MTDFIFVITRAEPSNLQKINFIILDSFAFSQKLAMTMENKRLAMTYFIITKT